MYRSVWAWMVFCSVAVAWGTVGLSDHTNTSDSLRSYDGNVGAAPVADTQSPPGEVQPWFDGGSDVVLSDVSTSRISPFAEEPAPFGSESCSPNTLPDPLYCTGTETPTRVHVAPYLWIPAVQGTTTVLGVTNDVAV